VRGKVIFEARNTHLSGGKFDDGFALLQPFLSPANSPGALQLGHFASEMVGMNRVFCGDTNQKLFRLMGSGTYDLALRDYFFDFKSHFGRNPGNRISADGTGMSFLSGAMKSLVLKEGAAVGITEGNPLLQVYVAAEIAAKQMQRTADPRKVKRIWEKTQMIERGRFLWTLPAELPGSLRPGEPSKQHSCLPGGVIDHIFFDSRCQVQSINVLEDREIMDPSKFDPPTGQFGGMFVTDHYPVLSMFRVGVR
jgi:hypothetical protein